MLDWTKIDNEKLFQQMVNDLFALEIAKPGYLPSSAYIGKDGGWDGRFTETYLGVSGMSLVQCKWTRHTLNDAYDPLRGELKGALDQAKANGVENLYFATNAELRIGTGDHVGNLEALNSGHVKNLFIYHRDALRPLIERSLWIRHKYFGVPQRPLFVPFTDYYSESEPDLITNTSLIGRLKEISEVEDFLSDNSKKVLLIHAPQGEGKSRFLFEVAKNIQDKENPQWQGWFCRPSLRTVEDAMQDEIDPNKSYVLFLDNADMYEETAKKLLDVIKSTPASKLKLVLSSRTPGKASVESWVAAKRITEIVGTGLEKLPEDTLIELLKTTAKNKTFEHPERIVRLLGHNPFFVIAYAKLMTGEGDLSALRAEIKNSLETGAGSLSQFGFTIEEAKNLLTEIAFIVPFRLDSKAVVEALAIVLKKDTAVITQAVEKLIEVGLLRNVGSSVRFSSDLNGNVYLGTVLDTTNGEKVADEAFQRWLPVLPENVATNIYSASRNADSSHAAESSAKIIHPLVREADTATPSEKGHNLSWIKHLVFLAPGEITNLLFAYANEPESSGLSRDTYGPLIQGLIYIPGFQQQALDLVRIISIKKVRGTYNNYEPKTLIKSGCSPIETGNFNTCIASMRVLETWVDEKDLSDELVEMITAGIREALSGSHEHRDSYGHTITFGRKGLLFSAKLEEYRNTAMEVYKKLLNRPEPWVQTKALSLYSEIGHDAYEKEGPLVDRIVADRKTGLDWIEELLTHKDLGFPVLAEAEDVLMQLWASNEHYPSLMAKAEELLKKFERSVEFQVYKLLTGGDFIISDFEPVRASAPTTERWSWLVHSHMRRYRMTEDNYSDLTTQLAQKYKTSEEILLYLNELDSGIKDSRWGYVPLVESWGEHTPGPFVEILQNEDLSKRIPERFRDGFMSIGAKNIENYIESVAKKLVDQKEITPLEVDRLMELVIKNAVSPSVFMPWFRTIIPKLNPASTRVIWNRGYFMFRGLPKEEQGQILELIDLALGNGLVKEHLEACGFMFHELNKEKIIAASDFAQRKDKFLAVIRDVERLDYYENELLEYFVTEIGDFLDLIEYRLKLNQEKTDRYIDAIPSEGLKAISRLVKSQSEFASLMNRLVDWQKADLISSYDIENLLHHVPNIEPMLIAYVDENILHNSEDGMRNAIVAMYALKFGGSTIDTYIKVLENAEKLGLFKEAKNVFVHDVLSGMYGGTIGEPPPALVAKKANLEIMLGKAKPGQIKTLVQDLIKDTENTISGNLKEAEEIMFPKE